MELSWPVAMQHHGHLTLTLDFQGQILKMLYLRNGRADWHGTKGMWIDRMLHSLCDFQRSPHSWPWPWIFKVKFWKSHISGMGWPIDMELKGCELVECWTHAVTFNGHITHDLYLGFSRSKFEKVVSQEWDGWLTWNERDVSWWDVTPTLWLWMSTSPMTLTLDFQGQILKMLYLRNGMADWHGTKGMWVDGMLHPLCDFECPLHPWPWPWIFKVKFCKCCISGMGGQMDMERKGFESTECWTHVVTFNVHLFHDLDLVFSRSNFEKVVSQEWDGRLTWKERDVSR